MVNISGKVENGVNIISVGGKVDSTNAPEFEQKLTELDTEAKLVLDLEELEYISSAGLRVILRARKKHADLEVKNVSSEVYEVFDMTGFTEMMHISRAYRRISVEGCEIIGSGANGAVYRIDPDTVVKVYLNPNSLGEIEHERDVARKALVLGIPTAISYDVVRVDDHYASMFEMINAKSFSQLMEVNPDVDTYVSMYVDLLKLIHGTEVPVGQLPDQRLVTIGWIEFLKDYLPADVYEKLHTMIVAIPHDDHMIHGDYHTKNLMLTNDEVILIDMDTLAVGHPILELASMYNAFVGFYLLDHEGVKSFLGYDWETSTTFWKRALELYLGTEDPATLKLYEDRAKIVGMVRMMRRTIRRNGDPAFIELCRKELCELAKTVDSLV